MHILTIHIYNDRIYSSITTSNNFFTFFLWIAFCHYHISHQQQLKRNSIISWSEKTQQRKSLGTCILNSVCYTKHTEKNKMNFNLSWLSQVCILQLRKQKLSIHEQLTKSWMVWRTFPHKIRIRGHIMKLPDSRFKINRRKYFLHTICNKIAKCIAMRCHGSQKNIWIQTRTTRTHEV